jgi:hypothetical protein
MLRVTPNTDQAQIPDEENYVVEHDFDNESTNLLGNNDTLPVYTSDDIPAPQNQTSFSHLNDGENSNAHIEESMEDDDSAAQSENENIENLFYRLNILFYTLCMPVVPILAMLLILLVQLILEAINSPQCSSPLRVFAFISLIVFSYAACHQQIKKKILNNGQEWSTLRPPTLANVVYDQFFYGICLMYIYFDSIISENCQLDMIDGVSKCATTCPELYSWFTKFHSVLMNFVAVLLLPLITLSFIYAWAMKRVIMGESLWMLEGQFIIAHGRNMNQYSKKKIGAKVTDILKRLREVSFHAIQGTSGIKVVGKEEGKNWGSDLILDKDRTRECCICLSEFEHFSGQLDNNADTSVDKYSSLQNPIVETKCGHFFHKKCIGGWIVGERWKEAMYEGNSDCRARSQFCPLCREDLAS